MPLSFTNPALLLGTLAAALPVIIHFLSRRRVQRRPFSDLRFLDEVQARQARSLGIRRWLLLLLRVLAILLLTLALAGPRWGGLSGGSSDRAILFLIDTSASMNTQTETGTRLETAVAACGRMIAALPGGTHIQVLASDSRSTTLFGDWLPAGSVPTEALAAVSATDGAFDLAAALAAAAAEVARSPGAGVDLILLSDLQKVRQIPGLSAAIQRLLGAGPVQVLVDRIGQEAAGGAVIAVNLPGRALRPGERVTLAALVRPESADQVFTLDLNGLPVAETVAEGPPLGVRELEFSLTVPGPGRHRGLIRKDSDRFPSDDSRPFILPVPRQIGVVLAHGADRPGDGAAGRGGWRILEQALAPGSGRSVFSVRALLSADLTSGDLREAGVLALVDPDPLGRRILEAVLSWLENGGSLLLVVGDPTLQGYLEQTLLPALGLPAAEVRFHQVGADQSRRTRLVSADHPLLQGFDGQALGTLQDISWRRWFSLSEGDWRALLTLVGDDPLLVAGEIGAGRAAVLASNLRPESGDAPGSAMVLPFLQRLGSWLAAGGVDLAGGNLVVGDDAVLPLEPGQEELAAARLQNLVVRSGPEGSAAPAELVWRGSRAVLRGGPVHRAGFLTFLAGQDTLGAVAAAVPGSESGIGLHTALEWRELMRLQGLPVRGDLTQTAPEALTTALSGRDLTPWLLGLTVLALLTELVVGRGAAPRSPASSV